MLYDDLMKAYLTQEAKKYAEAVIEFTKEIAVYDEDPNYADVQRCKIAYEKAVDDMSKWVRKVMLVEMALFNKCHEVSCRLILPDDEYIIRVCDDGDSLSDGGDIFGEGIADTVHTPIGEMSAYLFNAITEIEGNPVKVFYLHLGACIEYIHNELAIFNVGAEKELLTKSVLKMYCIFDVLGVYKMDSLLLGIDEFLKPRDKS